jgi:hypothetical protein
MPAPKRANTKYAANGIVISPAHPAKGETVRLVYNGLLKNAGAEKLYVHFGFGDNWDKPLDYRMVRTEAGFEALLPVAADEALRVCFRDAVHNWDNNNGQDYSFDVLD